MGRVLGADAHPWGGSGDRPRLRALLIRTFTVGPGVPPGPPSTGSWPGRGLSPPVRNCTDPRAREHRLLVWSESGTASPTPPREVRHAGRRASRTVSLQACGVPPGAGLSLWISRARDRHGVVASSHADAAGRRVTDPEPDRLPAGPRHRDRADAALVTRDRDAYAAQHGDAGAPRRLQAAPDRGAVLARRGEDQARHGGADQGLRGGRAGARPRRPGLGAGAPRLGRAPGARPVLGARGDQPARARRPRRVPPRDHRPCREPRAAGDGPRRAARPATPLGRDSSSPSAEEAAALLATCLETR